MYIRDSDTAVFRHEMVSDQCDMNREQGDPENSDAQIPLLGSVVLELEKVSS